MTRRELLRNLAQLAGLWALAVVQPLFETIKSGEMFVAVGWRGGAIVLFAVGAMFVPPLVFVAVEALVGRVWLRGGKALHLTLVAGLVAIFALDAAGAENMRIEPALVIAVLAGGTAAYLLHRLEPIRLFLALLAPASLLFLVLFLLSSPASRIVFPTDGADLRGPRPRAPVVMIVFDEFPTVSLLDGHGDLDRRAFPAFARLARDGTWFRHATTVGDSTGVGTSAILTGKSGSTEKPPSVAAQPNNLLALLGRRGGADAQESVHTQLCPSEVCEPREPRAAPATGDVLASLGRVSAAGFMPAGLYRRLPSTINLFPNTPAEEAFERLDRSFDSPATLHYLHAYLPHQPWYRLPSGRVYSPAAAPPQDFVPRLPDIPRPVVPDLRWTRDRNRVTHMIQRHVAQVRSADRLLGRTLERLRRRGLYDRSLIVVTADHGVAFRPGSDSRRISRANAPGIAFVPLFVKRPGQRSGSTSHRVVQSIDIAPTVADALGFRLPWRTDGRSLLETQHPEPRRLSIHAFTTNTRLRLEAPALVRRLAAADARRGSLFPGRGPDRIFRAGRYRDLIGRRAAAMSRGAAAGLRQTLTTGDPQFAVAPRSRFVPALMGGRLLGPTANRRHLAIAVNGTVAATAIAHPSRSGVRFEALVAERFFRTGRNRVTVYAIAPGSRGPTLSAVPPEP